jgi:hypothetical protein
MRGIIMETQECFLSADDWGVSGAQVDSKRVRRLLSSKKTWHTVIVITSCVMQLTMETAGAHSQGHLFVRKHVDVVCITTHTSTNCT